MIFSTDMSQLALVAPEAAEFVLSHDLETLACGRYELGNGDYVNVMEYTTKPRRESCYESHQEYADIQMVIQGSEVLEVASVETIEVTSPYDPHNDCTLYSGAFEGEQFALTPGRWCLVMPHDAHMPGIAIYATPVPVKKAVFKVRVDHLA